MPPAQSATTSALTRVREQTAGSPLGAGLVAFGIGFLVAAAFPATEPEIAAADRVTDALEPAKDAALDAARTVADDVKQGAAEAAEEVKSTAAAAAGTVVEDAKQQATATKEDSAAAQRDQRRRSAWARRARRPGGHDGSGAGPGTSVGACGASGTLLLGRMNLILELTVSRPSGAMTIIVPLHGAEQRERYRTCRCAPTRSESSTGSLSRSSGHGPAGGDADRRLPQGRRLRRPVRPARRRRRSIELTVERNVLTVHAERRRPTTRCRARDRRAAPGHFSRQLFLADARH